MRSRPLPVLSGITPLLAFAELHPLCADCPYRHDCPAGGPFSIEEAAPWVDPFDDTAELGPVMLAILGVTIISIERGPAPLPIRVTEVREEGIEPLADENTPPEYLVPPSRATRAYAGPEEQVGMIVLLVL